MEDAQDALEARRRVGKCVRVEAVRRDLKQQDLADRLGLSQASVSRKLAGRTTFTVEELVDLAEWFAVPIQRFFDAGPGQPKQTERVAS